MKTSSIKDGSLFEREWGREKVLILLSQGGNNKQGGCGHSILKQERKGSTLKRSTAGRREGDILWPRVELANNDDINTTLNEWHGKHIVLKMKLPLSLSLWWCECLCLPWLKIWGSFFSFCSFSVQDMVPPHRSSTLTSLGYYRKHRKNLPASM